MTCSANSKLKVNLEGESHNISFEQPVYSVEFPDGTCTRRHIPSRSFITGIVIGAFLSATCVWGWMELTNHAVWDIDTHRIISHEGAIQLEAQGIEWDADLKRWVESKAPSVTKLSPKSPNPHK